MRQVRLILYVSLFIILCISYNHVQAKAFPTAEGFGANTVGGRGGTVYKVVNLLDGPRGSPPEGSFRACLEATGPRTCIFDVGGTIEMVDNVWLFAQHSNLTIAGQTALGDGVQIKGKEFWFGDGFHDLIIRHMRFRPDWPNILTPDDEQTINVYNQVEDVGTPITNIIIDHSEFAWACHNIINFTGHITNLTMQWSMVVEPKVDFEAYDPELNNINTGFPDPGKCFGMGWISISYRSQGPQTFSIHHNLLSGIYARGPNLSGTTSNNVNTINILYDWRNNLHYNGVGCMPDNIGLSDYGDGPASANINWVGNRIIPGPSSPGGNSCYPGALAGATTKAYVYDNWNAECANNCADPNEWNLNWVDDRDGMGASNPPPEAHFRTFTPHTAPSITMHASAGLEAALQANVGPTMPFRDEMSARFLRELAERSGSWGREGAPWPNLDDNGESPPVDTDGDGMPDSWEQAQGTTDMGLADGHLPSGHPDGYTYLELYLNYKAGDTAPPEPTPALVFGVQPSSEEINVAISPAVTVRVTTDGVTTDTSSTALVTLILGANPGGATLGGTVSQNAISGVATFANLTLNVTGSGYTLVASASGYVSATSAPFTITPAGGATPTANPIYVSLGGPGQTPSDGAGDVQSCLDAENVATPKATVGGAMACMNAVAGKKLIFRGGTYPAGIDSLTTPIMGGSSWETATKFEAYPGETVTLAPASGRPLWLRNSDSYLIFKDLRFDAQNQAGIPAADIVGGNHIRFIDPFLQYGGSAGSGAAGLRLENTDAIEVTSAAAAAGPWLTHTSRIQHNLGHGVATFGTNSNMVIEETIVTDNEPSGLAVNLTSGSSTNARIERNTLNFNGFDTSQPAIQLGTVNGPALVNNLIFSNYAGILVSGTASNVRIDHQTIANNQTFGMQCLNGGTTIKLRNTILWNNTPNAPQNACTLQQTTNLITNPSFTDGTNNDFTLAVGSPAINGGTVLSEVTNDYLGNARPEPNGTAYDQGAYESGSTPPIGATGMGPLIIDSANPRYFKKPDGTLVFLAGAYDWNFTFLMSDAEATAYLDFWLSTGQNVIRAPTNDPTFETVATNPPFHTAYFAKLQQRLALAHSKGIYVILPILAHINQAPFNDMPYIEAYIKHVVEVAVPYDNVLFEVGNELEEYRYNDGNEGSIIDYWVSVINLRQAELGYTGATRRRVGVSDFLGCGFFFGECAEVVTYLKGSSADFHSIGRSEVGQHPVYPVNDTPQDDGENEHVSIVDSDHIYAYNLNHGWVWRTFMRGHNVILLDGNAFIPDHSEDDLGVTSPATFDARMRIGDTRIYAQKLDLRAAVPTPAVSTTGFALVNPGVQYLVYQPGSGAFQVTLPAGTYSVEWWNASTQVQTTIVTPINVPTPAATTFTPPASGDHVLFLQAVVTPLEPGAQVQVYEQSWFQ